MTKESMIYQLLDELKISYDRLDHEPISSVIEAAEKGIVLPGQQVKNLFLKNQKGRQFYLVILRDEKMADIKQGEGGLHELLVQLVREVIFKSASVNGPLAAAPGHLSRTERDRS